MQKGAMLTESVMNDHFLSLKGETGNLLGKIDWGQTSLGPVEKWPQSLITSIGTALKTKFPILIWWGDDLTLIYNDAYIPIFAGKHPEAFGKPGFSQFGWGEEEVRRVIEPMLRSVMRKGEATWSEDQLLILERKGFTEEAYFTWSYSPITIEGGKVGGVLTIVTETTERVIGQRRLNLLNDLGDRTLDAHSTDDAYAAITSLLREHALDLPFFIIYRIKAEEETAHKVGESNLSARAFVNPEQVTIAKSLWPFAEVIESGKEVIVEDLYERFGKLPGGPWPEPAKTAVVLPIKKPGQNIPYGILVAGVSPRSTLDENYKRFFKLLTSQISTAISKVSALEEERKRIEALQEIDKAKTAFFSNISHEFRTPLTLMLGPLEELLRNNARPIAERHHLEATHRNAMRLLRLVNTLLDFSRLEAGRVKARFAAANLTALTCDLASSFRSAIENAGLQYTIDAEEVGRNIFIDREMWEKIVLNLISNAFKYTLKGHITVRLKLNRGKVTFSVEDTGIGIPQKELPRMFERFHRVQHAAGRTHEGTGIGLSLVSELAALHGGQISVKSEEGKGSVFTVEIPTGKEHLPQEQVEEGIAINYDSVLSEIYVQEALALTRNQVDSSSSKEVQLSEGIPDDLGESMILVVDDNADMREYMCRLLSKNYKVETASNGMHAMQKLAEFRPQVIITDIMMPVMDGIQFLNTLRKNSLTANIPVIVLSARAGEEARIEGYELGADDYLVKPFSAKELLARVKSQIKIAKVRNRAEMHLKNIFQQAPVIIVIFRGPNFIIELANEKLLEYWDRKLEDILHKPLLEALPEISTQGLIEILTGVYTKGERFVANEREVFLKRNGQLESTYVSFVYEPLRNDDGTIDGIM
ncbi:MAG TPA: response regulator, partial [Chryseosolibacter sp.]|nr:response regulator [Chryseosolibacter sp.]